MSRRISLRVGIFLVLGLVHIACSEAPEDEELLIVTDAGDSTGQPGERDSAGQREERDSTGDSGEDSGRNDRGRSCEDECAANDEAYCQNDAVRSCADHDGDGCREWGERETCAEEQRCRQGRCLSPATHFADSPIEWTLPSKKGDGNRSYWTFQGKDHYSDDSTWKTMDLTGDAAAELVVTGYEGRAFGSSERYWKVYENTGTGFADSPIEWTLPPKDVGTRSFWTIAENGYDEGARSWRTMDLTGDGDPDLVVSGRGTADGPEAFAGRGYYWKVYENTGSGFATPAITWTVPPNSRGDASRSFWLPSAFHNDAGQAIWTTMDLTGDGAGDLVVTSIGQKAFGRSERHWKVYENTGSGFAESAIKWTLPEGGAGDQSYWKADTASWATMDLTGDEVAELVVTGRGQEAFGSSERHWKVYENTGSGFAASATKWPLPPKGGDGNGSYGSVSRRQSGEGERTWGTRDLTGDGAADLAVTGRGTGSLIKVFEASGSNELYWKVYENTGSGFATSTTVWTLPPKEGDDIESYSVEFRYTGETIWTTMDLTGDGAADLVVTSRGDEAFGSGSEFYWKVYPGKP